MMKRYFTIFTIFILVFPPMISSDDNSSISLSQTILDLNQTNITKISPNTEFIYHFEIKSSFKDAVKDIKLIDNVPQELTIIKFIDQNNRWNCEDKKNMVTCSLKDDLISKSVEVLDLVVKIKSDKEDEIINSAFVNNYDNDVSSILVLKDKKIEKIDKSIKCRVDNEHPKIGDIVNFLISSEKDEKVFVELDENLKFIDNDRCKLDDNKIVCTLSHSKDLNISAKVLRYGYAISDFSTISSIRSIPLQIDREFIPDIKLSISSDKKRVVSGDSYIYSIDINSSNLKEDIDDVSIVLTTLSDVNIKYIRTITDDYKCNQDGLKIECITATLDKNTTTNLKIEVKAPTSEATILLLAEISPNDLKNKPIKHSLDVVKFDYSSDKTIKFSKREDIQTSGKMMMIGDSVLEHHSANGSSYLLPNSKLFKSYKTSSSAKLSIEDDEEIIFAKLYWMGKIDKNIDFKDIKEAKNISFKNQKDKEFKTLESNLDSFSWINDGDFFIYIGMMDVSEYVSEIGSGIYEVSGLKASEGFGGDGSWSLVVVTEKKEATEKSKQMIIYDGFLSLWDSENFKSSKEHKNSLKIKFKDFKTPLTKKPDARLFISSLCGDRGYLDKLSISDKDGISHDRMDILVNSESVDIDISYALMKNQKTTDIAISSVGDKAYMGVVALQIKVEK